MYAWNPAEGKLVIFYTDLKGGLSEGLATQDGSVLAHDHAATNSDGSVDTVRVRMTENDANAFTNEIFEMKEGACSRIAEVASSTVFAIFGPREPGWNPK